MASTSTSRVAYYYKDEVANYNYGDSHPMKPYRLRLTNELIGCYGMYSKLAIFEPPTLSRQDLLKFHTDDFIDFLHEVTPEDQRSINTLAIRKAQGEILDEADVEKLIAGKKRFNMYGVDGDCPIFEGVYQYCQLYAGGSVAGALRLNKGAADIAINWSGGLHHAKKAEVSGFCYVNDIVLGIVELLRYHQRVLYIDIDVHHGCGVEEAFYLTDRVMTVSFHNHGNGFFPQTGALGDVGEGAGKNYSLNFPLQPGIDDENYQRIFKSIIGGVMQHYRPGAIVLQGGADSLTGDKLGPFNLTLRGHGFCAEFCKSFGVPLLMLGGGGYTVKNVARAWAYETAVALGIHSTLNDEIPFNNFIPYWKYDYKLHIDPMAERVNMNPRSELQQIEAKLLEQLKSLDAAPSVQYSTITGRDSTLHEWREEAEKASKEQADMDTSRDGSANGTKQHQSEFFAGNKDQDASSMGIVRPKPEPMLGHELSNGSSSAPMEQ